MISLHRKIIVEQASYKVSNDYRVDATLVAEIDNQTSETVRMPEGMVSHIISHFYERLKHGNAGL